jgi:hypothetical protein
MNTQWKRKTAAQDRKHPTGQQHPNTPPGTPPPQPEQEPQPGTERQPPEVPQRNIPERPAEPPNTPQKPHITPSPSGAPDDANDHSSDPRWEIPGARSERVNQPKDSDHAPSHVDYLEPNRKD